MTIAPIVHPDSDTQECNLVAVINRGRHLVHREATPSDPIVSQDDARSLSLMHIEPIQDEDDVLGWTIDRLRNQQLADHDIRSLQGAFN